MSDTRQAFRVVIDSMAGFSRTSTVFMNFEAALIYCGDKSEEFTNYKTEPVELRVLNEREGLVGRDLVDIRHDAARDMLRERVFRKLTPEEIDAIADCQHDSITVNPEGQASCDKCGNHVKLTRKFRP